MRRVRGLAVAGTFALSLLAVAPAAGAVDADPGPVRLLVTYAVPVDAEVAVAEAGRQVSAASRSRSATAATARSGGRPQVGSRVQVLEVDSEATATAIAARLATRDGVVAVERDVRVQLQAGDAWGVENVGQTIDGRSGTRGIDIGAVPAWTRASGRGVVVAVIDTGVDIHHPLLRGRIWTNPGERTSGRDDDGNGYVDDVHGWDFVDDTPRVFRSNAETHGTHVAGIIAGLPHVASGFRGVAPDARIMVLRFIDEQNLGWTSDAVEAIRYASDNGADVINLSFGGPDRSRALATAIAEAGIPVVVAAGNTGEPHESKPIYPAMESASNQITVAAVDRHGRMADFSSTSRSTVHVAAPGVDILSTFPGSRLAFASGTSMATPFVAGALALAIETSPDAPPAQLLDAVQRGIRPLAGAAETVTGGIARASGTLASLGVPVRVCVDEQPTRFVDVPAGHTHQLGVNCLAGTGVTSGISATRFGAELDLTRAQVASLVANALRPAGLLPAAPTAGRFLDVSGVHRDNVEALASVDIVRGVAPGSYAPGRAVTRAEFAGIVARAAEYVAGAELRFVAPVFLDLATSPDRTDIEMAAALSLVSGRTAEVFDPDAALRRDQAASMLVRLLDRLYQQGMLDAA